MPNNTLLEVKDLKMYFENKKGFLGKKLTKFLIIFS